MTNKFEKGNATPLILRYKSTIRPHKYQKLVFIMAFELITIPVFTYLLLALDREPESFIAFLHISRTKNSRRERAESRIKVPSEREVEQSLICYIIPLICSWGCDLK